MCSSTYLPSFSNFQSHLVDFVHGNKLVEVFLSMSMTSCSLSLTCVLGPGCKQQHDYWSPQEWNHEYISLFDEAIVNNFLSMKLFSLKSLAWGDVSCKNLFLVLMRKASLISGFYMISCSLMFSILTRLLPRYKYFFREVSWVVY